MASPGDRSIPSAECCLLFLLWFCSPNIHMVVHKQLLLPSHAYNLEFSQRSHFMAQTLAACYFMRWRSLFARRDPVACEMYIVLCVYFSFACNKLRQCPLQTTTTRTTSTQHVQLSVTCHQQSQSSSVLHFTKIRYVRLFPVLQRLNGTKLSN